MFIRFDDAMCQALRVQELPKLPLAAEAWQQALAVCGKIPDGDEFPGTGVACVAQNFGQQPNLLGLPAAASLSLIWTAV